MCYGLWWGRVEGLARQLLKCVCCKHAVLMASDANTCACFPSFLMAYTPSLLQGFGAFAAYGVISNINAGILVTIAWLTSESPAFGACPQGAAAWDRDAAAACLQACTRLMLMSAATSLLHAQLQPCTARPMPSLMHAVVKTQGLTPLAAGMW